MSQHDFFYYYYQHKPILSMMLPLSHIKYSRVFLPFCSVDLSIHVIILYFQREILLSRQFSISKYQNLSFFFFFFFFFFLSFWGCTHCIWRFPGQGSNWSCSHRPIPWPQQHEIQAESATYTTAHDNNRSLIDQILNTAHGNTRS